MAYSIAHVLRCATTHVECIPVFTWEMHYNSLKGVQKLSEEVCHKSHRMWTTTHEEGIPQPIAEAPQIF